MKIFRIRRIRKGLFFVVPLKRYGQWLIWELHRFIAPLLVFLAIMAALLFISSKEFSWYGWKLTTGFPDHIFCEGVRSGPVRQPANAWSSVIFITIGLWAARRAFLDRVPVKRQPPVRRCRRYGLMYGGALIVMGLGSWFFHASLTYVGHFVDVMGMYFLGGFLFTYGLSRKLRQSASAFTLVYVAIVLPLVLFQWFRPDLGRYAFASLIVSALSMEMIFHNSLKNWLFVGALLSLAFGFGIWILDEKKVFCSPNSFFQGHAAWHILTGLATQFSYMYYRSEAPAPSLKIKIPGRTTPLRLRSS